MCFKCRADIKSFVLLYHTHIIFCHLTFGRKKTTIESKTKRILNRKLCDETNFIECDNHIVKMAVLCDDNFFFIIVLIKKLQSFIVSIIVHWHAFLIYTQHFVSTCSRCTSHLQNKRPLQNIYCLHFAPNSSIFMHWINIISTIVLFVFFYVFIYNSLLPIWIHQGWLQLNWQQMRIYLYTYIYVNIFAYCMWICSWIIALSLNNFNRKKYIYIIAFLYFWIAFYLCKMRLLFGNHWT